jgi:hypothetical protein
MSERTTRRRDCSSQWHRQLVSFFVGRSLETTTQFERSAGKSGINRGDGVWKKNIRFFCYMLFCCVAFRGTEWRLELFSL